MISGISSMASTMNTMSSSSVQQRQPPPPDKDAFKIADSDQDGLVKDTELTTLLNGIAETTGNTISSDAALSGYDVDGDGGLNSEELFALLSENGFALEGQNGEAGGPPPPPPPSMEEALTSYSQNSGEDSIQQLLDYLQGDQSNEDDSSSINIAS